MYGIVEEFTDAYLSELPLVQDDTDGSVFGLLPDTYIPNDYIVNGAAAVCQYVLVFVSFCWFTQSNANHRLIRTETHLRRKKWRLLIQ